MVRGLIKMAKGVDKTALDEVFQPFPLLRQEAGNILVSHGIMDIDGLVTNIVITTNNELRSFFAQLIDIALDLVHIGELELQAVGIGSGRQIHAHHRNIAKISS